MFLDQLSDVQKNSYLALVTRMILADGDVAPEEDAYLETIKGEMGDGVMAPPEEVFGSTNAAVFDDRKSRVIAVLEILIMAYSDEHLHIDESTVLKEICGALEITDDELAAMAAWAEKATADLNADGLRAEAEAMMSEG